MHFAEYSHPFDLLNPDTDSSDEEEKNDKKRKVISEREEEDADKTEEYDSDDVSSRCRVMRGDWRFSAG